MMQSIVRILTLTIAVVDVDGAVQGTKPVKTGRLCIPYDGTKSQCFFTCVPSRQQQDLDRVLYEGRTYFACDSSGGKPLSEYGHFDPTNHVGFETMFELMLSVHKGRYLPGNSPSNN